MSYYLGKVGRAGARLYSSCKDLYNDVNAAYLTGAVDIIAIRQKDGSLKSTPFHVRFGKLGVLRTGDIKEVEIEVNGAPVELRMKIDETGKTFFGPIKTTEDSSNCAHVAIPMEPNTSTKEGADFIPEQSSEVFFQGEETMIGRTQSEPLLLSSSCRDNSSTGGPSLTSIGERVEVDSGEGQTESLPIRSKPIEIEVSPCDSDEGNGVVCSSLPTELEVFSDSAIERDRSDSVEDVFGAPSALSDTEVEIKDRLSSKLWEWSAGRRESSGEPSSQYPTALSEDEIKQRLPQPAAVDRTGFWGTLTGMLRRKKRRFSSVEDGIYLDDIDYDSMDPEELSKFFPSSNGGASAEQTGSSGIGSSPLLSPTRPQPPDSNKEEVQKLVSNLDDVAFSLCGGLGQGTISEETFLKSQVSFEEYCKDPVSLFKNPNLVVRVGGKYYNWQVAAPMVMSAIAFLQVLPSNTKSQLVKKYMPKKTRQSFWRFWGQGGDPVEEIDEEKKTESANSTPSGSPRKWDREQGRAPPVVSSDEEPEVTKVNVRPRQRSFKRKKSEFTNELTSEQLACLPLKQGANDIMFSITTKYQGTAKAMCTLYLWDYFDKIVVSDIDGTITRSDVAGQLLPLLGKDWTQNGVVELFDSISRNGYRIIYLSARAIGQAWYTKDFLRKIRRDSSNLPDGPLLLFPFSLYKAFKKEVIEKRPQDFKIECLKQIKALFPSDYNPFHAGFGNKFSDVTSYTNVDIPHSRIYTVNHKGHIKHHLSLTFQSSYTDLMGFVDAQFPPVLCSVLSGDKEEEEYCDIKEDYSTFNFWRPQHTTVQLPELNQ